MLSRVVQLANLLFILNPTSTPTQTPTSTLSSRAKSRDLLSAGAKPHWSGRLVARADSRSFDCVNGLASESIHSAQDDRVRVGSNFDILRILNPTSTLSFRAKSMDPAGQNVLISKRYSAGS